MKTDVNVISAERLDLIAEQLSGQGYIVLEDFVSSDLANSLLEEATKLSLNKFSPAGIGRENNAQINSTVRSDSTLWLVQDSENQRAYLNLMEQLRQELNSRLFMGLFDFECHFSHYKKGDFYQKHVDAFKGRSNRVLSTVFYLNSQWQEDKGGELVLYQPDSSEVITELQPHFNRCIIFLSDMFPHEVLPSPADRFSIAGWFRVNGNMHGQLDPSR